MGSQYQPHGPDAFARRSLLTIVSTALLVVAACTKESSEPKAGAPLAPPAPATLTHAELPAVASAAPAPASCPEGMLLVDGAYCPVVEQECERWMDPPGTKYAQFRCARYKPSVCKAERVHMRFCIDATERKEDRSSLPKNFVSFYEATKMCGAAGGHVCTESEWQFACEGEDMLPYPYGYERDSSACNVDTFQGLLSHGHLADHRDDVASHAKCKSPFGVMDMAGNVEEWVAADGKGKFGWKQVLKGSYWIPSRHACRQFQVGHGPEYGGRETGTRCCKGAD